MITEKVRKRERSNAKCVELLDMEGNSIAVYPSGIAVATALGIQQGDVSLCCRGMKYSAANHRFRFLGAVEDQYEVVKRRKLEGATAAIIEPQEDSLLGSSRSRRVSRGDYNAKTGEKEDKSRRNQYSGPKLSAYTHIKVRKWKKAPCPAGNFVFQKWVSDTAEPNPEFREYLQSKRPDTRKSKSGRRTNVALQSRY